MARVLFAGSRGPPRGEGGRAPALRGGIRAWCGGRAVSATQSALGSPNVSSLVAPAPSPSRLDHLVLHIEHVLVVHDE